MKAANKAQRELQEQLATERAKRQSSARAHQHELQSLRDLLTEARDMLDTSQANMAVLSVPQADFDQLQREKETLLYNKGELEQQLQELLQTTDQQRSTIRANDATMHQAKLRLSTLATERDKLSKETQQLKHDLEVATSDTNRTQLEAECARLKGELETAVQKLSRLRSDMRGQKQLTQAKSDELIACRQELASAKLLAAKHEHLQTALTQAQHDAAQLRQQLQREIKDRSLWAKSRGELLSQFCHEPEAIQMTLGTPSSKAAMPQEHNHIGRVF